MLKETKELLLSETYNFDVLVCSQDQSFAADLLISPKSISLRIMGETDAVRKFGLDAWKIAELSCKGFRDSFLLMGLSLIEGGWRVVGPNGRKFFENTYEVQELFHLHSGNGISAGTQVSRVALHSPSIARWLGHTKLQNELLGSYQDGTLRAQSEISNIELICNADENSNVVISYDVRSGYSLDDFVSQMSFNPLACQEFASTKILSTIPQKIEDLLGFFSFVCGGKIALDRVAVSFHGIGIGLTATGSYYKKGLARELSRKIPSALISFGMFQVVESEAKMVSWDRVLGSYFSLPMDIRALFGKYLKYRELDSVEERFLGFFRLLEKLTHQAATFVDPDKLEMLIGRAKPLIVRYLGEKSGTTSLLRGVARLNRSKYNTEKCIALLLERLPTVVTSGWRFTTKDLVAVCKLRNDIVHANNYQIAEDELFAAMVFVELMLTTALAEKLRIPLEESSNYLPQHCHYAHIAKKYSGGD